MFIKDNNLSERTRVSPCLFVKDIYLYKTLDVTKYTYFNTTRKQNIKYRLECSFIQMLHLVFKINIFYNALIEE